MLVSEYTWKSKDGVKIFGREWRPEGDIKGAISLVHGLGEHSGRYQQVAEAFTGAGYALVGFDLRGHGMTEGIRGHAPSYDCLMDDIDENLRLSAEHFPDLPLFLYGHSLGANLVLYHTLTRKSDVKGAIATSPIMIPAQPVPAPKMLLGKIMYRLMPSFKMANDIDLDGLSHDQAVIDRYAHDPLVHPYISARLGLDMLNGGQFLIDHAGELSLPLLLLQGSEDRIVNPKATAEFAAHATPSMITYKEFPGMYHELHNDLQKSEVMKLMIQWMDSKLK